MPHISRQHMHCWSSPLIRRSAWQTATLTRQWQPTSFACSGLHFKLDLHGAPWYTWPCLCIHSLPLETFHLVQVACIAVVATCGPSKATCGVSCGVDQLWETVKCIRRPSALGLRTVACLAQKPAGRLPPFPDRITPAPVYSGCASPVTPSVCVEVHTTPAHLSCELFAQILEAIGRHWSRLSDRKPAAVGGDNFERFRSEERMRHRSQLKLRRARTGLSEYSTLLLRFSTLGVAAACHQQEKLAKPS